uniref:Uncharacterized protein n=1 Tax=blood disease bacterium R229 TaxID=741978 RepID=G2ZSG9_9RALS|nr:hypothetical protein BDB_180022 [blood disease bacterium R229]
MVDCTFELNGQPMSILKVGAATFSAFSGRNSHLNKRQSACLAELGPIPPGAPTTFLTARLAVASAPSWTESRTG